MADEVEIVPHPSGNFQTTIFDHIKYRVTSKNTPVILWSASNDEIITKKMAFTESTIGEFDENFMTSMECNICTHLFLPGEDAYKVCVRGGYDILSRHNCQYFLCGVCIEKDSTQERPMVSCPNCRAPLISLHRDRFIPCKTKTDMIETVNKLVSDFYQCQSLKLAKTDFF